jgi:transcriptional regulator with XRE-family HTH domain
MQIYVDKKRIYRKPKTVITEFTASMKEFKERLQYLVDRKKISQRDIAERLQINEARISDWLTGRVAKPRRTTLLKLAEYFSCSVDWLAEGKGDIFPPLEIKTAENVSSFGSYKVAKDIDSTLAKILREKFKQQCHVHLDEFFDFIADNYDESKEGIDQFLAELHNTHANYRVWLIEKKQSDEDLQTAGKDRLTANSK